MYYNMYYHKVKFFLTDLGREKKRFTYTLESIVFVLIVVEIELCGVRLKHILISHTLLYRVNDM